MKPDPQLEIRIFADALQITEPNQRAEFLGKACSDDAELRQRIEAFLEAHEQAGEFLQKPVAGVSSKTVAITTRMISVTERPGDRIGRYKILEQIGEGGCGVVYVAEQEEPVRRRVALKVIKLGMDTKQVVARFEAERQYLALMDHPNIAKVFDAGATDTGRPYFIMELVRGIRITDYCDKNNLSTEERIRLFIQVCSAIQHAHQKGIIHRDIKPSNVLVTLHDGVPVPKVIDFGIAKATSDQRLTDKTVYTAFEQFIGTPAYMSPEQAEMSGLDIDTRSDIYALGVLLYELLTGRTPFDAATFLKAGLDQMRRIICEQEPQRPSTRLSTLEDAALSAIANHRRSEPPKLIKLIRGDLDWIVMKSLEKDRTRRFETVNALALDLRRHLDNEPVVARPPSQLYRLQKLIQRNKLTFAAAGVVVATLLIGLGFSTWQYRKEKEAHRRAVAAERQQSELRDQAERERLRAEAEKNEAQVQTGKAQREKDRADAQTRIALGTVQQMKIQKAEDMFKADNTSLALALLAQVLRQNPSNRVAAERIMAALTQRNFLLPRLPLLGSNQVAEFSPDGRRLATVDASHRLAILDARTGQVLTRPIALSNAVKTIEFSPDGTQLLTLAGDRVSLWNSADLVRLKESVPFSHPIHSAHFTSQGPRVISVNGSEVSVLHGLDGSVLAGPLNHTYQSGAQVEVATFSRDGSRLIVGSRNSELRVWNATNGLPITEVLIAGGSGPSLAFSPDGKSFIVGSYGSGLCYVYDTGTSPPKRIALEHSGYVGCVDFSPSAASAVTGGGDGVARIWDVATGKLITDSIRRDRGIRVAQFDPSGKRVITSSWDGTIRLWDSGNGTPLSEELHYEDPLGRWGPVSPDGSSLFLISAGIRVSPDGSSLLLISAGNAQVWDLRPGRALAEPDWNSNYGDTRHTSPDGRLEVKLYGRYNGMPLQAQIFDHRTQEPLTGKVVFEANILSARFSPDSQRLVLGIGLINQSGKGRAEVFDTKTGQQLMELPVDGWAVLNAEFSRDGRKIATGAKEGYARVWDAQTGAPITAPLLHGHEVKEAKFNRNGTLLLTIGGPTARVWDAKTGTNVLTLPHHGDVHCGEFSPDGTLVVTAGDDRAARIWEVKSGRMLHDLRHEAAVLRAAFSPDGIRLATGSQNNVSRVWDVSTGQQLTEALRPPDPVGRSGVYFLNFVDGGKRLATEASGSRLLIDVPSAADPIPSWLADLAEAVGGQRLSEGMQAEPVSPRQLFLLKEQINATGNATADGYLQWARWFFADRTARTISPGSRITVREYIEKSTKENDPKSFELDTAEQLANGDTELLLRILQASERLKNLEKARTLQEQARVLWQQDNFTGAVAAYQEALDIRRKYLGHEHLEVADLLDELASLYQHGLGKLAESESLWREGLAIRQRLVGNGDYEVARRLDALASVLEAQGKFSDAEVPLRESLAIRLDSMDSKVSSPNEDSDADLIARLVFVLRQQGKLAEVQTLYGEVMKVGDTSLLRYLAWRLATSKDATSRDGPNAVILAKKAVETANRKEPFVLDTLAAAYAEAGQFEKAISIQKESIAQTNDEERKAELLSRLKLFESNTPYYPKD